MPLPLSWRNLETVAPLPLPTLGTSKPLAFLFDTFDIEQVVQTIGMGLPFALAFFNFLSWLLENLATARFC